MRPWLAAAPPLLDGVVPLGGTDWNQADVERTVDGDTVRLHRRRTVAELDSTDDIGQLLCQVWRVRVVEDDVAELPDGLAGRLVNLNTPEKADRARWEDATADLRYFLDEAGDALRCVTYDTGGGFDRLLVDLYYADEDGARRTATEWMLSLGWDPYLKRSQRAAPRTLAA